MNKTRTLTKKLAFTKSTVVNLNAETMQKMNGGGFTNTNICSYCYDCLNTIKGFSCDYSYCGAPCLQTEGEPCL